MARVSRNQECGQYAKKACIIQGVRKQPDQYEETDTDL